MYENYLYPVWGYLGFDYNPPTKIYIVLAWILSIVPSLWMPINLNRPSQLAYWVLYIAVIIPSMFVPLYATLNSPAEITNLMWMLFFGFGITGGSYLLPLFRFRQVRIPQRIFWKTVILLAASLSLWMIIVFRHHLQIVSFMDVYDLRDASNDVAEGSQVNYAFMLLTGAINPFLMGSGLYYQSRRLLVAGILGQILVFSVGGTKGSILSILFVYGIHVLLKRRHIPFGVKLTYGALGLITATCLSYVFSGYDPSPMHAIALFVVLMRTLSINGLVTAQYYDFFQHNPLTYLSHIKGVNWFVSYPYKYPIGQEIGLAYAGTTGLDATAHFWVTDGVAGFGLPGILLISLLCAFVFWVLDSVSQKQDPHFAALVTIYAAYNISNISLFTSLLSGGLVLLIFLLYIKPVEMMPSTTVSLKKSKSHVPAIGPAF